MAIATDHTRAVWFRSRARRLVPITCTPLGSDHVRAIWSRPCARQSVPKISALAPNGATASDSLSPHSSASHSLARPSARVPFPLVLVSLPLAHTSGPLALAPRSSPSYSPTSLRFDIPSHSPRSLRFGQHLLCTPPLVQHGPDQTNR